MEPAVWNRSTAPRFPPSARRARRDFSALARRRFEGWTTGAGETAARLAAGSQAREEHDIDLGVEPPTLDPALVYESGRLVLSTRSTTRRCSLERTGRWNGTGGVDDAGRSADLGDQAAARYRFPQRRAARRLVGRVLRRAYPPETEVTRSAGNFGVIEEVEKVDSLTVRLPLGPGAMAAQDDRAMVGAIPPKYASDPTNDFANNQSGRGRTDSCNGGVGRGSSSSGTRSIRGPTKGETMAESVTSESSRTGRPG